MGEYTILLGTVSVPSLPGSKSLLFDMTFSSAIQTGPARFSSGPGNGLRHTGLFVLPFRLKQGHNALNASGNGFLIGLLRLPVSHGGGISLAPHQRPELRIIHYGRKTDAHVFQNFRGYPFLGKKLVHSTLTIPGYPTSPNVGTSGRILILPSPATARTRIFPS